MYAYLGVYGHVCIPISLRSFDNGSDPSSLRCQELVKRTKCLCRISSKLSRDFMLEETECTVRASSNVSVNLYAVIMCM